MRDRLQSLLREPCLRPANNPTRLANANRSQRVTPRSARSRRNNCPPPGRQNPGSRDPASPPLRESSVDRIRPDLARHEPVLPRQRSGSSRRAACAIALVDASLRTTNSATPARCSVNAPTEQPGSKRRLDITQPVPSLRGSDAIVIEYLRCSYGLVPNFHGSADAAYRSSKVSGSTLIGGPTLRTADRNGM